MRNKKLWYISALLSGLAALSALPACAGNLINRVPIMGTAYSDTYRYKMTVYVETPEGMRSGSAVREIYARDSTNQIIGGMRGACAHNARGEAVVVDLGKRGVVFVLLTQGGGYSTDHIWQVVFRTFPHGMGGHCLEENIKYYANLKGRREVPLEAMPMMVTFADMNDPTSVQYVYGVETYQKKVGMGSRTEWRLKEDDFEKLFGKGVKLDRVELEMTNEPVTEVVEKWLPPFGKGSGFIEWRRSLPYGHPLSIDRTSFKKGYSGYGH